MFGIRSLDTAIVIAVYMRNEPGADAGPQNPQNIYAVTLLFIFAHPDHDPFGWACSRQSSNPARARNVLIRHPAVLHRGAFRDHHTPSHRHAGGALRLCPRKRTVNPGAAIWLVVLARCSREIRDVDVNPRTLSASSAPSQPHWAF